MSLSDPIGDMIARIKNAQDGSHKKVGIRRQNSWYGKVKLVERKI